MEVTPSQQERYLELADAYASFVLRARQHKTEALLRIQKVGGVYQTKAGLRVDLLEVCACKCLIALLTEKVLLPTPLGCSVHSSSPKRWAERPHQFQQALCKALTSACKRCAERPRQLPNPSWPGPDVCAVPGGD